METKVTNKSLMEKVTDAVLKFSAPLAKLAEMPAVASVQNGLIGTVPIIIIGSIFLVLGVLGSPVIGTSGKALLPFLAPIADKLSWMNSLTMGMMALYASVSIPASYADITQKIDGKSASLLGLAAFLIFNIEGYSADGGISVAALGASGLFVCILTSILSVKLYIFLVEKHITIRMPEQVPPNVGTAFTALIPYAACFTLAWLIRTVFNFDMVTWLNSVLAPLISSSENVFTFTAAAFIVAILWSVGLHGDNMFVVLFFPFGAVWMEENAAAVAAGVSVTQLPHVLAGFGNTGLLRMTFWTAGVWPLVLLLLLSKVKYLRTMGKAFLPASVFGIVEPVVFGLPLALNPFLILPFIVSATLGSTVGYLLMSTNFFGKFFAMVPWATPAPILGPLGTGDWKTALIPFIAMAIGIVIYLPFWRLYEKDCMKKELEQEAVLQ